MQESGEAADGRGSSSPYPPFDEGLVTEAELTRRVDEDEERQP